MPPENMNHLNIAKIFKTYYNMINLVFKSVKINGAIYMKNYFSKEDDKLKWTEGSPRTLLETVVCKVTSRHNVSSNGVEGDYIIMDAPDWAIVIPELDGNFLMVKQWRHGENALSVEFPGGVIDKGESPDDAARRELEEETGYKAGTLIKLGTVNPNPALFNNHVHFYLAKDLTATGKQNLDADEFINFMQLSKKEVLDGMGTEQFPHAIMGMALSLYIKNNGGTL